MCTVCSLVPPPAPYVTLIKSGRSAAISCVACATDSYVLLVLGGNTSKDSVT